VHRILVFSVRKNKARQCFVQCSTDRVFSLLLFILSQNKNVQKWRSSTQLDRAITYSGTSPLPYYYAVPSHVLEQVHSTANLCETFSFKRMQQLCPNLLIKKKFYKAEYKLAPHQKEVSTLAALSHPSARYNPQAGFLFNFI
jgi:hypothetical protein